MDIVEHYDKRFGVVAVEKGFITEADVLDAMKVQVQEDISSGKHKLIGRILLERKRITQAQIDEVLKSVTEKPSNP